MNFSILSKHLGLCLLLLVVAECGLQTAADEIAIKNATQAIADGRGILVNVQISLNQETTTGSSLVVNPTTLSVTVSGCASGYSQSGIITTVVGAVLQAYKFDYNCLAKLNQFIVNGMTYNQLTGFTTWLPNDTGTFVNSTNPLDILQVSVKTQLNSPVTGSELVSYTFSSTTGTYKNIVSSVLIGSHAISVTGNTAPTFAIKAVNFEAVTPLATTGVPSSGGAGVFDFLFECVAPQTNSGLVNAACYDATLTDIKYLLIQDTYNGILTDRKSVV